MAQREKLSNVDTAWLRMEHPTNLMMISGVMTFDGRVEFNRLRALLEERLLHFERFRQRVVQPRNPLSPPYWETVPDFDIEDHLFRFTPPVSDQAALQDLSSRLMSTPLDFDKPLWEFHFIENYRQGDSALFCRLHHCIADGIALVRVLLSLTDDSPEGAWQAGRDDVRRRVPAGPLERFFLRAAATSRAGQKISRRLIHESRALLREPSRLVRAAELGVEGAAALARIALRPPDPTTIFKGPLGVQKRAAWSQPLPLAAVKAVGKATGATVNDVLLTAMSGALRRYMLARGQDVEGLRIGAAVPVNLRPLDGPIELGNKFGLVFLSLPVGVESPIERLYQLKRNMDAIKGSPEPVVSFGILNAMGMAPAEIERLVVNIFGMKVTAVMTNVPGPRQTIYLAGQPVRNIMFWVPQSGRLGLGISILSYDGQVLLGVASDAGLVPDPENIVSEFHSEFYELEGAVERLKSTTGPVSPNRRALDDLHAQLDRLLEIVDELSGAQGGLPRQPAAAIAEEAQQEMKYCQGTTKAGTPCRKRPKAGSRYCHLHQERREAL